MLRPEDTAVTKSHPAHQECTAQRGKDRDTGAERATGGDRRSVSGRALHAGGSRGVAPEQSGVPWLNGDMDEIVYGFHSVWLSLATGDAQGPRRSPNPP